MTLKARLAKLERTGHTPNFEVWYEDADNPDRFTCDGATLTAAQLDEYTALAKVIRVVYEPGQDDN